MEKLASQNCYLLIKFIKKNLGPTITHKDWTPDSRTLNLEQEIGEFFYFHYRSNLP